MIDKKVLVLTEEQIDRLGFNDELMSTPISFMMEGEGFDFINEGEYRTYPIDTTVRYITTALHIPSQCVQVENKENGTSNIIITSVNKSEFIGKLDKAMRLCGYFVSRKKEEVAKTRDGKMVSYVKVKYEPKFSNDITDYVKSNFKYLYHITPTNRQSKISNMGLVPKSKNKIFDYPDRIYLFKGDVSKEMLKQWVIVFNKVNNTNNTNDSFDYSVFYIDVAKLPDDIVFYSDPNLKDAVYTFDNIAPSCIANIEILTVDKKDGKIYFK